MTDANHDKLIDQFKQFLLDQAILDQVGQIGQTTSEETYTDLLPIDCHNPALSYFDGPNRDNPYIALRNNEITNEQAIATIRKASEFTTITSELEGIYKAKVGRGSSCKDACNAVIDMLADFVKKQG
jgi:hypothetical protein